MRSVNGPPDSFAIVLTGGGARAAYQVGVLRGIVRQLPKTKLDIITGVSAGAINAIFLASRRGELSAALDELSSVWATLEVKDVLRIDARSLLRNAVAWGTKLTSGGVAGGPRVHGLVDTSPLRKLLERLFPENEKGEIAGVAEDVARCEPR